MSLGISLPWWGPPFKTRRFRHKTPREKQRWGTPRWYVMEEVKRKHFPSLFMISFFPGQSLPVLCSRFEISFPPRAWPPNTLKTGFELHNKTSIPVGLFQKHPPPPSFLSFSYFSVKYLRPLFKKSRLWHIYTISMFLEYSRCLIFCIEVNRQTKTTNNRFTSESKYEYLPVFFPPLVFCTFSLILKILEGKTLSWKVSSDTFFHPPLLLLSVERVIGPLSWLL